MCKYQTCKKFGHFADPNNKKNIYCEEHSLYGMVSIYKGKCRFTNCGNKPEYNYKLSKHPIACELHKSDTMVNVSSYYKDKCAFHKCNNGIAYNYVYKKQSKFCHLHIINDYYI